MSQEFTGKIVAEKYRIEELLREDHLGAVYRGTHLLMEKSVIIKVLSPALAVDDKIVKTFSEEARVNSHISHPNILSVTDFGSDADNIVYIIMESADGESLRSALSGKGKFETNRAIRVARQTAAALSAAHSNKVVHGQLKPENILLNHNLSGVETIKVSDFGAIVSADDDFTIEQGKYIAPEQYSDLTQTDERSDIYTLGVIFYEMLAGETPFSADTVTDLMLRKNEELPAPLSAFRNDVSTGIEPVILKALAKNPEARQQSAAEFVEELDAVFGAGIEQETIIVPKAEAATANNNLWKTAFVVLAGISLLSVALIYATQSRNTNPETQLQTDANGMPVQPLGAATGMNEQGVNNMLPYPMQGMDNSNMQYPEQVQQMPGGDGYDPWGRGGSPPPGGPPPIYPTGGGEVYLVPGNSDSVFMPGEYVIQVPKDGNVNANVAPVPTKTPKGNNTNTKPSPNPNDTPAENPVTTPTPKPKPPPAEKPKENPPSATEKRDVSGKQQDSE